MCTAEAVGREMLKQIKLNYVKLNGLHIFDQLQYEEILLRSTNKSWCIVNKGPIKPVIVTGLSGKIPELVHTDLARRFVV
jgi:hypothetical protein